MSTPETNKSSGNPTHVNKGRGIEKQTGASWREDPESKAATIAHLEAALKFLATHGIIRTACKQAKLGPATFYDFRRRYPDFAEEAREAMQEAVQGLEAVGFACARKALTDPRYQPTLIFTLKAKAKWTDRLHVTSEEKPVSARTDEELEELIQIGKKVLSSREDG